MPVLHVKGQPNAERDFSPQEAQAALASGEWESPGGAPVAVQSVDRITGEQRNLPLETATARPSEFANQGIAGNVGQAMQNAREDEFSTGGQGALALGEGLLSGATLSGSDWLLDGLGADTADRKTFNPGKRLIGEIGGALLTAIPTGGESLAATALARTPAALMVRGSEALGARLAGKLSGRMLTEAAQGAAFGLAQGSSNLALSNVPLTGEAVGDELVKNGLFGAVTGGLAGAVGHGAGNLADSLKLGRAARAAASGEGVIAGIATEDSIAFTRNLEEGFSQQEKAVQTAIDANAQAVTPKDLIYSYRMSRQLAEEAGVSPDGVLDNLLADPKTVAPDLRKYNNARRKLGELYGSKDLFDRAGLADAGGLERVAASPEKWQEAAVALDEMRESAVAINKKAGLGGETKPSKFVEETPEQLNTRRDYTTEYADRLLENPQAYSKKQLSRLDDLLETAGDGAPELKRLESHLEEMTAAPGAPEIKRTPGNMAKVLDKAPDELVEGLPPFKRMRSPGEIQAAESTKTAAEFTAGPHPKIKDLALGKRAVAANQKLMEPAIAEVSQSGKMLNESIGLKAGSRFDENAVSKFLALEPEKAIVASEAFANHLSTLEKFHAATGTLPPASTQIDAAFAVLKKNPRFSAESGSELISGLLGVEAPKLSPRADELLKVYLLNSLSRGGKAVTEAAPSATGWLGKLGENGARGALARLGASAASKAVGGGLGGRVAAGFGSAVGVAAAGKAILLVKGAAAIAEATGGHISRIAEATALLASGKASRAAAPTATALLNAYSFGTEPKKQSKNLQELYKTRMNELAQFAANPNAVQQRLHDNLEPIRQVNAMLADHLEMQGMRDAQHFYETAPKDPGTMTMLGITKWKPSEDQITQWASGFRALNPVGVWERTVSGRVTPQEAEALRKLRPETFKEIQLSIQNNLPAIQAKCTFDQRTRMMICFDVVTDPLNAKHSTSFIQESFVERANGPDGQPVEFKSGSQQFKPEEPTKAQTLVGSL